MHIQISLPSWHWSTSALPLPYCTRSPGCGKRGREVGSRDRTGEHTDICTHFGIAVQGDVMEWGDGGAILALYVEEETKKARIYTTPYWWVCTYVCSTSSVVVTITYIGRFLWNVLSYCMYQIQWAYLIYLFGYHVTCRPTTKWSNVYTPISRLSCFRNKL